MQWYTITVGVDSYSKLYAFVKRIANDFGKCFCGGRKTLGAGTRINNKLNPHIAPVRNRTRATLVEGERSHRYASSALLQITRLKARKVGRNRAFV